MSPKVQFENLIYVYDSIIPQRCLKHTETFLCESFLLKIYIIPQNNWLFVARKLLTWKCSRSTFPLWIYSWGSAQPMGLLQDVGMLN